MEARACTGKFRVHRGKWTIPKGKTSKECTYCEWCINNGCVQLEPGFTVSSSLNNCSCDCPIKDTHASIQVYDCRKHEDMITLCVMGRCRSCYKDCATTSSLNKYCPACSALFGICEVCGVTEKGTYPCRSIAKMLSQENGRVGK